MFLRAVIAFLALPGVVALLVPALIGARELNAGGKFHYAGLLLLVPAFAGLSWCVRDFHVAGKGTLAPWSPPRNLVKVGLYRHSRNPMYVAVSLMLIGWAVCFWSPTLAIYTCFVIVAFHLRVVFGEEPWLEHTHGSAWKEYKSKVPRWLL
jgi:protein-S-isoprenylcysteine O-methyltransferase Ste14